MTRCLVTGAGGFVGRHVAAALAAAGHEVVGLLHRSRPRDLGEGGRFSLLHVDLAGDAPLPAGPFGAVIHCAAAIPAAVADEADLQRINLRSTERVFAHARAAGVRRVIFCSSMAVYGAVTADTVGPDTPIREPGAYGRSKLAGEARLAELCGAEAGLAALSIRLPGVVGAGSHDNFLSTAMARLLAGEPVVARSPDAPFNNVVHVDDLAAFVVDLVDTLPAGHRVTTIASEEPLPVREVLDRLAARAGRPAAIRFEAGGQPFLVATEPARRLGYRVPTVRDSLDRFAADAALEHARAAAGAS